VVPRDGRRLHTIHCSAGKTVRAAPVPGDLCSLIPEHGDHRCRPILRGHVDATLAGSSSGPHRRSRTSARQAEGFSLVTSIAALTAGIDPRYSRRIYSFKRQFNGASPPSIYVRGGNCEAASARSTGLAALHTDGGYDHDEIVTHWNRNLYDAGYMGGKCQCVQGARPQDDDHIDHCPPRPQPAQQHSRQRRPARQRPESCDFPWKHPEYACPGVGGEGG
jgi:hypothetical protein